MHDEDLELTIARVINYTYFSGECMERIDEAKEYVRTRVINPALSTELPEGIRGKVSHVNTWLNYFNRVGDLLLYLQRFGEVTDDAVYTSLKDAGLLTFEDIVADFTIKFGLWAEDKTTLNDFVIGKDYSSQEILIFARNYDTRSGGMFVLGDLDAVVIKASLVDGVYPNKWIEKHEILKYYLKSIKGEFGEHFKANAAILHNREIPILTFVRERQGDRFIFEGIFKYLDFKTDIDGSKWFELKKIESGDEAVYVERDYLEANLNDSVSKAKRDTKSERASRLINAPKIPKQVIVVSLGFVRNADVIAEALARSAGICEACNKPAPFNRKSDGTPYLEVHHKLPLAQGGEDSIANAVAICPNCHRQAHFG